jgi:glycosyltransferase involved in cell wall biosynthesis
MKKINILFITVRSDIGGGPIHVSDLIDNLDQDKYNIFLSCPRSGSIYLDKWKDNSNIDDFIEIPHRKFTVKTLKKLKQFILKNRIDILHSHGKGAGIYSRLLKFKTIKVVHTFHGLGDIENNKMYKRIKNVYLEKFLKKYTDIFISVSFGEREIAKSYLNLCDHKLHVIYNGVKDSFYKKKIDAPKSVISFSRFSHQKNMILSYEVVKKVKKNILFSWIGNGEDFSLLNKKKENENMSNLTLHGFQNNPYKYLTKGSIYLSTSRHEGLPLALLEAEANGIPIIATDVVGNNEIVKNGYNGFLFKENEINKAAEKIKLLYKDKRLYNEISNNARKDYLERFTLEIMVKKTEKIYDEVFKFYPFKE